MSNIEMTLALPDQAAIFGLPAPVLAPKINNPFYEATELDKAGRGKDAERIYLKLLNNDFDNPAVLGALGMNYACAEKYGLAHALLQIALANLEELLPSFSRLGITPKDGNEGFSGNFLALKRSEMLNAIGTCYKNEGKSAQALAYFREAQKGMPPNPDLLNNIGTLSINEGKPEDALVIFDEAIALDPNHDQAHWNRSLAYLEQGDYARGWPEYEWGFSAHVRNERNYASTPIPAWKGEKGARVVVYGEQGIGDEILFASMLPELIADCELVVFECHRKLHRLFCESFPAIDIYPTREDKTLTWPNKHDGTSRYNFTHRIAIGSLGQFYRQSLDKFPGHPYLCPTSKSAETAKEFLSTLPAGRPNIGISWTGGHKKTRLEVRSVPLETLLPLLAQQANFVSLQYTESSDEITKFEAQHGIKIHQFPQGTHSPIYDDCAGLVSHLDLVITVCTSVVHLAGSLGTPVWVLTPSRPAWRYRLDLDTMPWYASSVLFRQAPGSIAWEPVVAEVADALANLLTSPKEIELETDTSPDETETRQEAI